MNIDALTLVAILILVVLTGVVVRICTLAENACSGPNQYLSRKRSDDKQDGGAQ